MHVPTDVVAASQRSGPRGNGWMQLQEIEVPQAVSATVTRSSGALTHLPPSLAHPWLSDGCLDAIIKITNRSARNPSCEREW